MEDFKYKCETVNGKGCKTCGYKKLLFKDDNYYCRVCNSFEGTSCPLKNKKASLDNCKKCSWRGIKEVNIINTKKKLKDNLRAKKDPIFKEKLERQKRREEEMAKGYTNKALYNGYDKNHKERDALDYYATPPWEVKNILDKLELKFKESDIILEPCVGGGHMMNGIIAYLNSKNMAPFIIATDVQNRGYEPSNHYDRVEGGYGLDFDYFSENYPEYNPDYIIMNPPYGVAEGFVLRALDEARKGVLCLVRLQFLEGTKRFKNIFKNNPPTFVYTYIDRIQCYKDGDFSITGSSAQAYAWFYWEIGNKQEPVLRWINRSEDNSIEDWR